MFNESFQLAFIGPGGPEFIVIMLVLLLMFGAKDAPRIFRKMNEVLNQIRNTADSFKREVLYSDLNEDATSDYEDYDSGKDDGYPDYAEDFESDYPEDEEAERDYSNETFEGLEQDLEEELKTDTTKPATEPESEGEDGHAPKT